MTETPLALKILKTQPGLLVSLIGKEDALKALDKYHSKGQITDEQRGMILLRIIGKTEDVPDKVGLRDPDWEYD